MPAKMLNDTGVKAEIARVVQAKKRTDISDKGIRGLVLRITPTGSATFAFAYRPKGGRTTQRITIGSYPLVTLAKARQIALGYAQEVAVGKDIAGERRTAHAAAAREKVEKAARLTVAEAIERYLKLQVTRAATRRNFRNLYNSDVIPAIGGKAIADVTKADVQRIVDAIEDRGALRQAGLALAMVRSLLNWCVARGYLEASPIKGLKNPHASTARSRYLSVHEIRAFWRLLPDLNLHEAEREILRLELLLGQRVGEIAGMMRHEIDLARKVWVIPEQRTKNGHAHDVPLPPMAREIIERAMRASTRRLLFPRPNGTPITTAVLAVALQRVQPALGFKGADGSPNPFTTHDLRRSLATWLEQSGTPSSTVSLILNHRAAKAATVTTSHYLHGDTLKAKRLGLTYWEKHIRAILAGEDPFASAFDDPEAIERELLKDAPQPTSNVVTFARAAS